MKEEELKYWLWFLNLKKITRSKKEELLNKFKEPKCIYNLPKEELSKEDNKLSKDIIEEILNNKNRNNLEEYIKYMKKNQIHIITMFDKEYPEKLKVIYDKPIALFYKGNINLLKKDIIAIVGSRMCSLYGKTVSYEIAKELSENDKCIISGLAKGIDVYAHIGSLKYSGRTIAVLAHGFDMIYPIENKKIYEEIIKNNGLILSEHIMGEKLEKRNFPERNRIISGLSDGILVVEAGEKSGALITAEFGLEDGKEIFAIPGNINSLNSKGTNNLIKEGAYIVTSAKDILEVCYGIDG